MTYQVWQYYIFHTAMANHILYIRCHTTTTVDELRSSTV